MAKSKPLPKTRFVQLVESNGEWYGLDDKGDIWRSAGFTRGPLIDWVRVVQIFSEE